MMASFYEQKNLELQELTKKYAQKLIDIWQTLFQEEACHDNVYKLINHIETVYRELLDETYDKRRYIEKEIEELKNEAEDLRRLLNVNIILPEINNSEMPLLMIQSEIDKSLSEMRQCLRERKDLITELLLQQDSLCDELGEPPRPLLADPLPTQEEIDDFVTHLESLKDLRYQRVNELSALRREIKHFLQILELQVHTEAEDRLLNYREIKLDKETFEALKKMHDCFGNQVQEMKKSIDNMRKNCENLWERLEISPQKRDKFKKYHGEYNQSVFDAFYAEMQRCEELKQENIQKFVEQIRREIVQWSEKTLKSRAERKRFQNFDNSCYTDDLLALHEIELEELKLYYEENKHIFELFDNRKELWERMIKLEEKAKEPGRYNNRGGQLLKEEKERKLITTKLPKIEAEITALVNEYEQRHNKPFLVYGKNILEVMLSDWQKKREEKEQLTSARKRAQTPGGRIITTPLAQKNTATTLLSSMRRTPSVQNITSSRAPTPFTTGIAQKRKLNASEKATPQAKRSLLNVFKSPAGKFLKPMQMKTTQQKSKNEQTGTSKGLFKSPMRKMKVIGSTIVKQRRSSGRRSLKGNNNNNNSTTKGGASKIVPKITISEANTDDDDDNEPLQSLANSDQSTYEDFQKSLKPESRSSIVHLHQSKRENGAEALRRMHMYKKSTAANAAAAKSGKNKRFLAPATETNNNNNHKNLTNFDVIDENEEPTSSTTTSHKLKPPRNITPCSPAPSRGLPLNSPNSRRKVNTKGFPIYF